MDVSYHEEQNQNQTYNHQQSDQLSQHEKQNDPQIDVSAGTLSLAFGDIPVHFRILDAVPYPYDASFVFRAPLIDQIVDDYMFDIDSVLQGRKHPFLSNLHTCCVLCIESESEFEFDPVSDFYVESEFEFESSTIFVGVVPLEVDYLESKFTNRIFVRPDTALLLYETQAGEPSYS